MGRRIMLGIESLAHCIDQDDSARVSHTKFLFDTSYPLLPSDFLYALLLWIQKVIAHADTIDRTCQWQRPRPIDRLARAIVDRMQVPVRAWGRWLRHLIIYSSPRSLERVWLVLGNGRQQARDSLGYRFCSAPSDQRPESTSDANCPSISRIPRENSSFPMRWFLQTSTRPSLASASGKRGTWIASAAMHRCRRDEKCGRIWAWSATLLSLGTPRDRLSICRTQKDQGFTAKQYDNDINLIKRTIWWHQFQCIFDFWLRSR